MRDVQPVVAAEREEEVVACDVRDRLRLEAEQLADAVVLVDDVVARAQVGERLQRPAAHPAGARCAAAEDLRVGSRASAEVAPDEAAARGSDGEEQARARRRPPSSRTRASTRRSMFCVRRRFALVRERDDDAVAGLDEAPELLLGFGEAARGDRRLLRLERERLARRQRVELADSFRVEVVAPELLEPDALHLAGSQHEVGRAIEYGHQVLGNSGSFPSSSSSRLSSGWSASSRRSAAG